MKILVCLIIVLQILSLSQGFPRPSSNEDNAASRRQGVNYGYPENPSEPYTSNQATAYSSDPSDTSQQTTYASRAEPAESISSSTADQQAAATYQNTAAQESAQKTPTASPYAESQSQTTARQTETSNTQAQSTQTQTQASESSTSTQSQTQPSTSQTQNSASTGTQTSATQTSTQAPAYQDSSASNQANSPATSSQSSTQTQTPQTQDATASNQPQTPTSQTQTTSQTTQDSSSTSRQANAPASSTQSSTQTQTPQTKDTAASNQPQSQTTTQTQTSTAQDSQSYNQNKGSDEYVNPPQPYNAAQANPNPSTSSYNPQGNDVPDNTQYKVENVTSKTVPDSNASSPVYLSSSSTSNIADSRSPDDSKKSPTVNKETTVNGNHATTYLELPKHLHKPAIVKYQVQIEPKVKGVPIEQEIAIMPPEGSDGERKPLVLLKQVVSKPTDERIQVIVPKGESSSISSPKVEVKGGHVDQEALNGKSESQDKYKGQGQSQSQVQGQYQDQSQDQSQYQSQSRQYQSQDQYQDQSQGQYQDQSQDQSQSQYQDQSQGQGQYQDQSQSQGQYEGQGAVESQDFACRDLSACDNYNPNMCNQVWMKRHCKKMCGLCTPQDDETLFSISPSQETSAPKPCEYSGVVHQSGETWSPGPCVPKCHCDNGNIKCSRLECPDLNCDKPVKRRWKCCPECLPNSDNETRCGVETSGGNGEKLCCVFPFNYHGVDYFTCTTTDAEEPWCSITRNYDRDGLWGNCVVKSKTGKKHGKQADSDEKTALILAAQLSGARKWRNSTNNQVTDALKSVPSPLSEDELKKLRAKDASSGYTDVNGVYQTAPGASNITAQADYYSNAGVNLSQVSALDSTIKGPSNSEAYQGNSTSSLAPPGQSSPSSASTGTQASATQTSTQAPTYQDSSASNQANSPATSSQSSTQTQTPQTQDSTASNQPQTSPSSSMSSSLTPSPNLSEQPVYNTTYNPSSAYAQNTSNPYSYQTATRYDEKSSEAVGTYSDNRGSDTGVSNTARSNNGGSNTGGSTTGENQYSSYYRDTNNPQDASAYGGSYDQQSTATDTTDNTVPNGIENQTSYEMNPDASTAQYGNNQPATT